MSKPRVAIKQVDQAAVVDVDVVALRARKAADRLGDVAADLLGRLRILDVDDAQAAAEPGRENEAVVDVLLELVRAEAADTAPRAVGLADMEGGERLERLSGR